MRDLFQILMNSDICSLKLSCGMMMAEVFTLLSLHLSLAHSSLPTHIISFFQNYLFFIGYHSPTFIPFFLLLFFRIILIFSPVSYYSQEFFFYCCRSTEGGASAAGGAAPGADAPTGENGEIVGGPRATASGSTETNAANASAS